MSLTKVNIVNEMGEEQIIWSCDAFVKKRGGTIVKKVATSVGYVVTRGKIFYLGYTQILVNMCLCWENLSNIYIYIYILLIKELYFLLRTYFV